ncbi:MAG: hypothetical protein NTV15_03165, partial [Candidatus Bathyarchaeota archaeon]|nr:hypothetical protein [Candidatus Bathyarchaeota archaeon]
MIESPNETIPVDLTQVNATKSTLMEASKNETVKLVPELVGQSTNTGSNAIDEPIDVIREVVPKNTMIEDSKTVEPVNLILESVPQNKIETTIKTESTQLEDTNRKQTESRRENKKPAPKTRDHGSKITDIEGIGPIYAEKLNSIGINTTSDLLEFGATPRGRKE